MVLQNLFHSLHFSVMVEFQLYGSIKKNMKWFPFGATSKIQWKKCLLIWWHVRNVNQSNHAVFAQKPLDPDLYWPFESVIGLKSCRILRDRGSLPPQLERRRSPLWSTSVANAIRFVIPCNFTHSKENRNAELELLIVPYPNLHIAIFQENEIKARDPIRCRECGYRIMYKKRTKRLVVFDAR